MRHTDKQTNKPRSITIS